MARCREICDGQGPQLAFDAAGVQAGLTQAILAIRARGTVVNIAVWEKPASIFPNDLVFREKKYMGTTTFVKGDFPGVIDAISKGELGVQISVYNGMLTEAEQVNLHPVR